MYCYKPTKSIIQNYHLIETIIDNKIKCLCKKEFDTSEIIITKGIPRPSKRQDMNECTACYNNLRRFWRNNVKSFTKVEGTSYHRINNSDNMVIIKDNENAGKTN